MSAKDVARAAFEAWNRHDFARLRELMHPEISYTGGDGEEQKGPDAGIALAEMYVRAFPDLRSDIVNIKEAGDTAIVEFVASGTHKGELMGIAATGKPIKIRCCLVMETRDGKSYREREYFDNLTMMTQLGVVKDPTAAPV